MYLKITDETPTHYICYEIMFPKSDVVTNYHPLDDMTNVLHLHVAPFYNY
jgi:hypothetical protein